MHLNCFAGMTKHSHEFMVKEEIKFINISKVREQAPLFSSNFAQGQRCTDEHMAGQINSGSNSLDVNIDSIISSSNNLKARFFIKFGAFSVDVKQMWKAEKIDSMVTLPTKIIFRGVNFHKKMEEKKQRKYFYIGAMEVDVDEVMPT